MRAVLDTNILIDHLKGIQQAADEIVRFDEPLISPITWMEVMAGASDEAERIALRQFLAAFGRIELTEPVMERAARLRTESRMRLPDAIVLASALCHNLMLVTRNTKDFDPARWANVRVPYLVQAVDS
jgi:predicted nucleic acid-binding protein